MSRATRQEFAQDGNIEGHLYGETVVFTGALAMTRREAAQLASTAGCTVADGVNKKTTLLVVGQQDAGRTKEIGRSSKQIKAEELIRKGQDIMILAENDFLAITESPN